MSDLISRQAAIDAVYLQADDDGWWCGTAEDMEKLLKGLSPTQPEITQEDVELYCRRRCLTLITNELFTEMKARWLAQPDPIKGKWLERSVDVDGKKSIKEWQSAKCSVCGRYHTTPFLYYFDDFNFCPNCGARMEESNGNNT